MSSENDNVQFKLLLIFLLVWETGVFLDSFIKSFWVGNAVFVLSFIIYVVWTKKACFLPYKESPFKNKNFYFHKRDKRIKFALLIVVGGFTFMQFFAFSFIPFSNHSIKGRYWTFFIILIPSVIILLNAVRANKKIK